MKKVIKVLENIGWERWVALGCFLLSIFLNFLYSLYSKVDLFNINFARKKKKLENWKVRFISANIRSFYIINCLVQTIFGVFISSPLSTFSQNLMEKLSVTTQPNRFLFIFFNLFLNIIISLVTQVASDFVADKMFSEKIIFNRTFLNFAFFVARFPTFLGLKLSEKPTSKTRKEIKRFFQNLKKEKVLREMEFQLLKTSLDLRNLEVRDYLVPWKKVICLTTNTTWPEIQKTYSQYLFSNYPVLDEKKKVVGLLSYKMFMWAEITKKNPHWKDHLIEAIMVSPQATLSQLFKKLQKSQCQMAIVQQKGKIIGIITKKIVLEVLLGEKLENEEDKLR